MSFLICLFWRKILSPYCLTEPFEARLVFFVPLLEIKKFGIVFEDVAGNSWEFCYQNLSCPEKYFHKEELLCVTIFIPTNISHELYLTFFVGKTNNFTNHL